MRAYELYGINDLRRGEVKRPVPKPGEVLVEVKAAGICGSDIPRIFYTGTYSYPLIPGHEFSGVVAETGADVDRSWQNRRVGIFPLIPCRDCAPCRDGHYEMCRRYGYLGSRTNGGFAEYVAVPEWNLIELPGSVSFETAAMMEPMAVAVHAMRSVHPAKDKFVAVWGLGTVGLLLAMFLREAGIDHLFVIGNKNFQRKRILDMGIPAEHYCDSREQEIPSWLVRQSHGLGADVLFECVGKNETIAGAIDGAAPGGQVQLVGNPESDIALNRNTYWKILRNQLTVKGSWNSSFTHSGKDDWHYILERLEQGRIHPEQFITQKFAFGELEEGLRVMRDKKEEYEKVMIYREEGKPQYCSVFENEFSNTL